jgi:hypothetical protein
MILLLKDGSCSSIELKELSCEMLALKSPDQPKLSFSKPMKRAVPRPSLASTSSTPSVAGPGAADQLACNAS